MNGDPPDGRGPGRAHDSDSSDRTTEREETRPGLEDETIRGYRVVKKLGEGGMGVVYLAMQTEPVRRQVAIKVIRLGMDTKEVVARFEVERQALAVMDHPGIATVFDAGITERGRPYFAMEFVPGIPLTAYCNRHDLPTRERLKLFISVCHAVQHAHHKGVIHRDLKPSNILVMEEEGGPLPKIIDFGIAKATRQRSGSGMTFTSTGHLVGTPEYMSPEQADLSGVDVDTRTDIYALGAVLYELLTDRVPLDGEELRSAGLVGMQRIIQEKEPPSPSARVTSLGGECREIARHRKTEPRSLTRQLRGDLDWIVMKALEKDRTRRYETVNGLALDIQRYLDDEPVHARPPSTAYRFGKFVRRHRLGVAAAVAVTVALIGGIVGTGTGLLRAQREAAKANAINEFLADVLTSVDPRKAQGREVTVREILDEAARKVDTSFAEQREVEALVRGTIGGTYTHLGHYRQAEPHLERSVRILTKEIGPGHEHTLNARHDLAVNYFRQGRYDGAESIWENVLDDERRLYAEDDPRTLRTMQNLAAVHLARQDYERAEPLLVSVSAGLRQTAGVEDPKTTRAMNNLAELYKQTARFDRAEPLCREVLDVRRRTLGDRHPQTLIAVFNMGDLFREMGRFDRAESLFAEALDGFRRVMGEDHSYTLFAMTAMADVLMRVGKAPEAEPLAMESYERHLDRYGETHAETVEAVRVLVEIHEALGNSDLAARWRDRLPADPS